MADLGYFYDYCKRKRKVFTRSWETASSLKVSSDVDPVDEILNIFSGSSSLLSLRSILFLLFSSRDLHVCVLEFED